MEHVLRLGVGLAALLGLSVVIGAIGWLVSQGIVYASVVAAIAVALLSYGVGIELISWIDDDEDYGQG